VRITRREFSVGALALAGTAVMGLSAADFGFGRAAAQTVSTADLMQPGALPEMVLGAADAPVTMIEYASMTCPHCAHFSETTFPELRKRYIDTGKVRYIFREFPLDDLAAAAFVLARCNVNDSGGSDLFMGMVELLFQTQQTWAVERPLEPLLGVLKQAGFSQKSFETCLANQKVLDGVRAVRDAGVKLGVSSTPTFFINGKKLAGDLPIETLEKEFQPYLKSS
jgi:protein-disulfide isomerase